MEIVGFIACLVGGIYAVLNGVILFWLSGAFTGRSEPMGAVLVLVGLAVIFTAFWLAPFHISIEPPQ